MTGHFAWKQRRGQAGAATDLHASGRAPSVRQVLDALGADAAVQWTPAGSSDAAQAGRRWSRASIVIAVAAMALMSASAWLAATDPASERDGPRAVPQVSPRLEQIAATARSPLEEVIPLARSEPEALVLMAADTIEIEAGGRAPLSAHVANESVVPAETVALVRGLPDGVRLTDGIMIGPGLWMVRADLLPAVELEAAASAGGHHTLMLELRTPEGTKVSSAQTELAIAAARHDPVNPNATARHEVDSPDVAADDRDGAADDPARSGPPMPSNRSIEASGASGAPPVQKGAVKQAASPAPVARDQDRPIRRANARQKVPTARPARKAGAPVRAQVTVLSAATRAPQPPQQPRLVWPGDDPRSASYAPNPPFFLGGVIPGVASQDEPPQTAPAPLWRERAFRRR